MYITCKTELTPKGVEVTHPTIGKIATIERKLEPWGDQLKRPAGWFVMPYSFAPHERAATFQSYEAAEFYSLALAYEMHATGMANSYTGEG